MVQAEILALIFEDNFTSYPISHANIRKLGLLGPENPTERFFSRNSLSSPPCQTTSNP